MKNKIITGGLLVAVVTLLSVLALNVRTGATADSVAILKTDGMTCGSCSSKITKALDSLKGVAVTEVNVEGGWVIVGYDTKGIQPETLAEKVNGTGFGCTLQMVLTPDQFKRMTGRAIGQNAVKSGCGCCGTKKTMAGKGELNGI